MKDNSKPVEYKETHVFELFPDYKYTRQQRFRLTLFHGYKRNIVKLINYASNFDKPDKICLVYIVGEPKPEKIMSALENAGCSSNVCVLTSPFPDEKLKLYKEFDKLRTELKRSGNWDNESMNVTDAYLQQVKAIGSFLKKYPSDDMAEYYTRQKASMESELELIHQYHRIKKASRNTYFKKFTCYRTGCLPKPWLFQNLDTFISKIYRDGPEGQGINEFASVSPISIDRAMESFQSGVINPKLGFTIDDSTPAVRQIRRYINKQFEQTGYCMIRDLADHMRHPPYGLGWNGYSAYCFVYALSKYDNRTMLYFDNCSTWIAKEVVQGIYYSMFNPQFSKSKAYDFLNACLYIESSPHKIVKRAIAKVFGVTMQMPSVQMAQEARRILEEKANRPVVVADQLLYDMVTLNLDWFDRERMQELADKISGHEDELHDIYENYLIEEERLADRLDHIYSQSAPWCWSEDPYEQFWKNGKPIVLSSRYARSPKKDVIVLVASCCDCTCTIRDKDVIGINRKLLGEDTTMFFCMDCFADYLGCSVEALQEKIKQFKAEGCKLFQ